MTIRRVFACMDVGSSIPRADQVESRVRAILGHPPRGAHRTLVPRGAARCRRLPGARQPGELSLQHVDVSEVTSDVVVAAVLAGMEAEAASCVGVARAGSAQVDDRSEILLLLERRGADSLALERLGDAPIEEGGGHRHGVARDDARVEAVEPARTRVVPGAGFGHHVTLGTEALLLPQRLYWVLVHADGARRRLVHPERVPGET